MFIVINGGGKVASFLARTLLDNGHSIALIEKRDTVAEKLATELPKHPLIILGDGCDVSFQEDAGVGHADVFAAVTGDDDDNLVSCQLAKTAFGAPRCVARVNNPKNAHIFNALGIEAISSTSIIARMIEEETAIGDLRTLASLRKGNMAVVEIELPTDRCRVCDKKVRDLALPVDCVLFAIVRGDDVITVHGDTTLQAGDVVVAFTAVQHEANLKRALTGE
jgi:trk system potassium uptake protein TrkA